MKERVPFFLFPISDDDFDLRVGLVANYVGGILVPSILFWRLVRLGSGAKQLLSGFALGGMFLMASFIMGSTVRLLPNQKHHNVVWPLGVFLGRLIAGHRYPHGWPAVAAGVQAHRG